MLTVSKFQCLRNILSSLFLLFCINSYGQTPGLIVRSATSPNNAVLDLNQDGFTSPTTNGFITTDVGVGFSEIPYKIIPAFKSEPTADLMRGPSDLYSDLVQLSAAESGMYVYNDGTNLLFRLRLGSIISGSKGYSILIDADGLFGPTGPYADPNFKPATTGINGNPGFELEVVMETNFRVAVYDVDGKDDAGTTPAVSYGISTNSQISIAISNESGTPDYFYDFYVPLSALKYANGTKSISGSTPIRIASTTVMSPQAAIGGPKSDIFGYSGSDYMKAWETIINGQPTFTPDQVKPSGVGVSSLICTAAPTLNSPISTGTSVTISGKWTQSDVSKPASATITLFRSNGSLVGTATVSTGGTWSISGVNVTTGDIFYAKAQSSGESACLQSNSVQALGCTRSNMSSVSSIAITCSSDRGFDGTAPANAVVRVYTITSAGYTLYADETTTTYKISRPGASTRWVYDSLHTNSSNPCTGGQADVTIRQYAVTIQEPGKCESDFLYFYNGPSNSPCTQTATPIITQTTLYAGNTTVSGTAATGATVRLFVNGVIRATTIATDGSYNFTTSSMEVGDVIDVYAHSPNLCISSKATRTVVCYTAPPVIKTNSTGNLVNGTLINGTSNEATGTDIRLYRSDKTLLATVKVAAGGTWTTSISAATGTSYYATAQNGSCGESSASATVAALAPTTVCATITGLYNETATLVSGTISANFSGTVRLYQDSVQVGFANVSNAANWNISLTSNTLYPGGVLFVTTQSSTGAEKTDCNTGTQTISCGVPDAPAGLPATMILSRSDGKIILNLTSSQSGVLYTLEDATTGADRSISVLGTGGAITITSYAFLTPNTYSLRINALKLSGSSCGTASTSVTLIVADNDTDGIADPVDIDDDNDGILDSNETVTHDATGDADGDGIPNYKDTTPGGTGLPSTDSNGDGIVDYYDTDRDGIINQFDLDADNDGIPDIIENGGTDNNNDGKGDIVTDANKDGLYDIFNSGAIPEDFDKDGIPNFLDLDADGDGVLDSRESGLLYDSNNNGTLSDESGYADTNKNGRNDAVEGLTVLLALRNTDGRSRPDYLDIDNDDDGIVDIIEAHSTSGYQAPIGTDADKDGIDDRYDNNTSVFGGIANNGITPLNSDTDILPDYRDLDSDNDGFPDAFEGHDTDGDNLPNANSATKNGIGGSVDVDGDGLLDGYDNNTAVVNPTNNTTPSSYPNIDKSSTTERDWREVADNDGDGVSDLTDVDDDNDGIPDLLESGGIDPLGDADGDGILNYLDKDLVVGSVLFTDSNNDGINDFFDTDKDGIINSFDLDSDNDGIPDIIEAGGVDTDGDGRVDGAFADSDGDGLHNKYDASSGGFNIANLDTDGDGIKNFLDLDSDNDGIPDVLEAGGTDANHDSKLDATAVAGWDSNGNGLADAVTGSTTALIITGPDANNDGKPDIYSKANQDGRGLPNPYDIDADDDGITDNVEGQATATYQSPIGMDGDGDGLDDRYDDYVGFGGKGIVPVNTDGTDDPDYLDSDTDNDGDADIIEGNDLNDNGKADDNITLSNGDADGDGLDNVFDLISGPVVTINGFSSSAGSRSPAQRTPTSTTVDRDWRNIDFSLTANISLPVHFVSFNAAKQSNGVQLTWNVTSEVDVKSYEIEKSTNGSRYTKIGEVAFRASNSSVNRYQFLDASLSSNTVFYRIRQVDIDGKFMFSSVVSVHSNDNSSRLAVHPNIVYTQASVVFGVKSNQQTTLIVCDMQGKVLIKRSVELQKGQNVIPADTFTQLAGGTYILTARIDDEVLNTKFIKQ